MERWLSWIAEHAREAGPALLVAGAVVAAGYVGYRALHRQDAPEATHTTPTPIPPTQTLPAGAPPAVGTTLTTAPVVAAPEQPRPAAVRAASALPAAAQIPAGSLAGSVGRVIADRLPAPVAPALEAVAGAAVAAVQPAFDAAQAFANTLTPQQVATLVIACVAIVAVYLAMLLLAIMPASTLSRAAPLGWAGVGFLAATAHIGQRSTAKGLPEMPGQAAGVGAGAGSSATGAGSAAPRASAAAAIHQALASGKAAADGPDETEFGARKPPAVSGGGSGAASLALTGTSAPVAAQAAACAPLSGAVSTSAAEVSTGASASGGAGVMPTQPAEVLPGATIAVEAAGEDAKVGAANGTAAAPAERADGAAHEALTRPAAPECPDASASTAVAPAAAPAANPLSALFARFAAYVAVCDACQKAGLTEEAGRVCRSALEAAAQLHGLGRSPASAAVQGILASLPDIATAAPSLPQTVAHDSPAAAARYARDYPTPPPDARRFLAAFEWRMARYQFLVAGALLKAGAKEEVYKAAFGAGLKHALRSLALHDADCDAHKYASILYAKAAKDTKEQISFAYKIREHSERALALRPDDPVLAHVLGVWHYEVAGLSWLMRKAASALYGTPPTSTYEEALRHLTQAETASAAPGSTGAMMATRLKIAQVSCGRHLDDPGAVYLCDCLCVGLCDGSVNCIARNTGVCIVATVGRALFTSSTALLSMLLLVVVQCHVALKNTEEAKRWVRAAGEVPVGASEDPADIEALKVLAAKLSVAMR